jgi:hypothetical protein
MSKTQQYVAWGLSAYIAFVFVQSLFFKFSGSAESIFIFGTLRDWSGIGLFEPFGRWFIGFSELVAAILLFVPGFAVVGAGIALVIITGAIFFHLFTPIGVEIMGDGGELFILACGVWLSAVAILFLRRDELRAWLAFVSALLSGDRRPSPSH